MTLLMLALLAAFFGLFAGLTLFCERVIARSDDAGRPKS
jgi:hypothetical protein